MLKHCERILESWKYHVYSYLNEQYIKIIMIEWMCCLLAYLYESSKPNNPYINVEPYCFTNKLLCLYFNVIYFFTAIQLIRYNIYETQIVSQPLRY